MRVKVSIIILLVVGGVLTANLLINDQKLSSVQIEKVTRACLGCHGSIPTYDAAMMIHNKHAALNCSHCHSDDRGLKVADSFRIALKWLSIGITLFALTGIIMNLLTINRKGKVG